MTTRRKRVLDAIEHRVPDRVPKDLGAMNSTGVSCFAYPKLVEYLGLPPRKPRVHDTGQMLALPDTDVLDALDCDVIAVSGDTYTNAFDEPDRWFEYDFDRRLAGRVVNPASFSVDGSGTISQQRGDSVSIMPPASHVFDSEHAGQIFDIAGDLQYYDLDKIAKDHAANKPDEERVANIVAYCRRARETTDRAIMFAGLSAGLGFHGGIPNFSMLCMNDPAYVHEFNELATSIAVERAKEYVPLLAEYVDILMLCADDQGLQTGTILPPDVFGELFVPYYRRTNDAVHKAAPGMKTFLHSCGAIYDLIDMIVESGFDILNPVQWSAGRQSYSAWKDRARGKICLWGGGINTQTTLPLGSVDEVRAEAREVVSCLREDSGFVFCAIHNILAEIPPEKIVAIYEEASG